MKRVMITGSSGYFGSKLVDCLAARSDVEKIVGLDVRKPMASPAKFVFHKRDVREPSDDLMTAHKVDAVIHAAWVLPPIHDTRKMEDININGTRAILNAAAAAGVSQLLYTSSTTAYGFHPDNEHLLTEESPLRGNDDFTYSRCKRIIDRVVQDFAAVNPQMCIIIVRPCFVVGPGFANPMANHLQKKVAVLPSPSSPIQLVHEDDLMEAMVQLMEQSRAGVWNVVGDEALYPGELVKMLGNIPVSIPVKALWAANSVAWNLRLSFITEFPSPALNIFRYPWLASSDKLKQELGFEFQYDTRTAFADFVRHTRENRA